MLRKLCSQQSSVSVVSLAFLASFKNCFFLKKKKSLSAERSLGCGAHRAVGTYYYFMSVPQAVDDTFLGTGAISQPCILSPAPSETAGQIEGVTAVVWPGKAKLLFRKQAGKHRLCPPNAEAVNIFCSQNCRCVCIDKFICSLLNPHLSQAFCPFCVLQ